MHRTPRARIGRALSWALRLWLVLALWPTPLPWVHHHRHEHSRADRQRLAVHLLEFHPHEVDSQCDHWHLHFADLWRLARGPCAPDRSDDAPPSKLPATPAGISPAVATIELAPAGFVAVVSPDEIIPTESLASDLIRHAILPGGFLNSYGAALAPHQLLGVLRC